MPRRHVRALVAAATVVAALNAVPTVAASPDVSYPDITGYVRDLRLEKYSVADKDGIWFTTPFGLRCAIETSGAFGCSGTLPGVQPENNEIGWFPHDPLPRLYHSDMPRFDSGTPQTIVVGNHYLEYHGSRCAITHDSAIYCIHSDHPNSQIMVSGTTVLAGAGSSAFK